MAVEDLKIVLFNPIQIKQNRRNIELEASEDFMLTKPHQHGKILNPNVDALSVLPAICSVNFKYNSSLFVAQVKDYIASVSLMGILRALLVLRVRYPDAYRAFVTSAKLLSYKISEDVRVAPLQMLFYANETLDTIWNAMAEAVGVTREQYAYSVITAMQEFNLVNLFSVFKYSEEDDKKEIEDFISSFQPPRWLVRNIEKASVSLTSISLMNFSCEEPLLEVDEEELSEFVASMAEAVQSALKSQMEKQNAGDIISEEFSEEEIEERLSDDTGVSDD